MAPQGVEGGTLTASEARACWPVSAFLSPRQAPDSTPAASEEPALQMEANTGLVNAESRGLAQDRAEKAMGSGWKMVPSGELASQLGELSRGSAPEPDMGPGPTGSVGLGWTWDGAFNISGCRGKRVPLRGPQPSNVACLQGQPQAFGWAQQGRSSRMSPGIRTGCGPSPVGARAAPEVGVLGLPMGRASWPGLPRPPATSPALCSNHNHFVLPH